MEAIFEVYTDLLVERADGFVDQVLLWVLRQDIKEFCVRYDYIIIVYIVNRFCISGEMYNQ